MSDFETVKARADIVDLVGQYTTLQRAGRYFKACCPFHNEKTPSFYVYPDQQSWHCFGACSTGGDVISFIEKKENLTPVEALRMLADRYGVQLERRGRQDEPATGRLIEANEAAATYFHNVLMGAEAGEPGRAYLATRALDDATVRAFRLGYSLDGWDGLRDHLSSRGFSVEEQVNAGLLTQGDKNAYDRFRGRLMFPIADERGRVIGFGGRVLGEGVPKYLNTPQTPLFDKGGTLFALDRAKDAIRDAGAAVVVEGYMDAITAHQHGITNVVATLGTALTERHIALLKRYARSVVLAMDADAAGVEAALRGEELVRTAAVSEGGAPAHVVLDWRNLVRVQAAAPIEVRVFTVPHGKDPDEAIRADPSAFRELTQHAVPPFEFRLRHDLAAIDRDNPRERRALAERLLPLIAAIADRALQAQYLAQLAQATAIPEDVLSGMMQQMGRDTGHQSNRLTLRERVDGGLPSRGSRVTGHRSQHRVDLPTADEAFPDAESPGAVASDQPVSRPRSPVGQGMQAEMTVLHLLLAYQELRSAGMETSGTLFTDPDNRALFGAWKTTSIEGLPDMLDESGREHLGRVLAIRIPPFDATVAARAFTDAVARLRRRQLEDRARMMAATVRESASAGSDALAARALATLAGDAPSGDGSDDEAVAQLLKGVELAHDLHTLEANLRTHRGQDQPSLPGPG